MSDAYTAAQAALQALDDVETDMGFARGIDQRAEARDRIRASRIQAGQACSALAEALTLVADTYTAREMGAAAMLRSIAQDYAARARKLQEATP